MKRFLFAVCFLLVYVSKTLAQCTFTVDAGADTTICANQSAHLHGTVVPAGAYTYSWTPTVTLTGANTLTPTATCSDTTTYILSVTGGGCTAVDSVHVNVKGAALILSATISPTTPICPGTLVQLNAAIVPNICGVGPACSGTTTSPVVGSGTVVQPGASTAPPTLMGNYAHSGRNQMLYTAAELSAALGGACTIKGVGFYIQVFNSNAYLQDFTISIACTNQTSLSTFDNNLVQVVPPSLVQPIAGWNDFGFANAYNWDGVSNLIVDICWNDPQQFGNQNNKAQCTNTGAVTSLLYSFGATNQCGTTNVQSTSNIRPNARFGYCLPNITNYPIIWTPASGANAVNKPDSSDPTAHPVTTQDYTVAVANGTCISRQTVTATVDTSRISAGPDLSSCPGAAVTLTATAIGNVTPGPATFTWTTLAGAAVGNGANVVVNPVANATYVVSMAGGACTHTDTVKVTLGSLNVTTAVTNVSCYGLADGKIVVTAANGTSPYNYSWVATPNPGNSNTATGLSPGTYYVTASDVNTCSGTASAVVTQPTAALANSSITVTQPLCYGNSNGIIVVTPSGGTKPYTYAWNNGLPPDSLQNGLAALNYSLTTTDARGCTATSNIPLSQPAQITFGAAVIQNVRCPGLNTGKITVNPSGGVGAFTYSWSQNLNLNSPTATGLGAGSYIVTVTDTKACTATASNTITPATLINFAAPTVVNAKCFGSSDGSATVNPTGGTLPYSYAWNPSGQTTQTATALSAQAYTVTVTDDSLCTASSTINVQQPSQIQIAGTAINITCNGSNDGAVNITSTTNAVAPLAFIWSNTATTQNISSLSANTYYVTLTDANGCTAHNNFVVTEPTLLVLNAPTQVNDVCFNGTTGSLTANATGGTGPYSYLWSNTASTQTISNLAAGPYTLAVKDAGNCTATATYTITQPASGPAFGPAVVTDELCNGGSTGSILVSVSGGTPGYTYSWSQNAQLNNPSATGLTSGTYKVTATDAGGCSVSSSNTVNQPLAVSVTAGAVINVSCHGGNNGSAIVNVSGGTGGGYTYTWNGVAGSDPQGNLAANTYTVVVSDGNNCTASTSIVVNEPSAIQDSIVRQNVKCHGGADGSLTVYAYGGNSPFTYLWGDGTTAQTDGSLAVQATPYVVTITDNTGCTATDTASLTEPSLLTFTHSETQVTCPGAHDGTISCAGNGGVSPYSFSVTKDFANVVNTTNGIATQLDSGFYYIEFNDHNGCLLQDTAFIKSPVADSFLITVDSTSCFGPAYTDGSIYVTALTANNMPYTYTIDNGARQDTSYFANLAAGPHRIIATNQFGCTTTLDTVVAQPVDAYAHVLPKDTTIQLGHSITLYSGFGPFSSNSITSYNWVPSEGLSCIDCPDPIATPYSHISEYVLTITYNGICVTSDSMRIIVQNHAKPFIPNSFSPNGDGNNDVFEIYGENIKTVNLRVFNRWGELVYESTNLLKGWDGYYKGQLQYPGVYTYDAEIIFLDDTKTEKHGSITLLR